MPRKGLSRRAPTKQQNKRILIVCEGAKTEPYYFEELVRDLRINGEVEVTGKCGSAPISVVEKAIDLYREVGGYDLIFCVFDRDGHASFDDALRAVASAKLKHKSGKSIVHSASIVAITSVPCFEYWVLLHFCNSDAPLPRYVDILPLIRRQPGLGNYEKGARTLYGLIKGRTDDAISNARRVQASAQTSGATNPLTQIHELVLALRSIAATKPCF